MELGADNIYSYGFENKAQQSEIKFRQKIALKAYDDYSLLT